jgi:uncharacterized membrane protein YcaP (DUF421 family)
MQKEEIKLSDFHRLLFGEAPPEFLIEVLIRTLIVFVALLVFLRLIGKRMGGVLTISELAVMLTLGAVLAVPMQMPDRGVLQGILILVTILFLQRGLNLVEFKSKKVEQLTQGEMIMLVKDGVILNENMNSSRISKQQLFSKLRESKIHSLGNIRRVYLEACGVFSIYQHEEEKPGLSVLPKKDQGIYGFRQDEKSNSMSCSNCGHTDNEAATVFPCEICGNKEWLKSVI